MLVDYDSEQLDRTPLKQLLQLCLVTYKHTRTSEEVTGTAACCGDNYGLELLLIYMWWENNLSAGVSQREVGENALVSFMYSCSTNWVYSSWDGGNKLFWKNGKAEWK